MSVRIPARFRIPLVAMTPTLCPGSYALPYISIGYSDSSDVLGLQRSRLPGTTKYRNVKAVRKP